MGLLAAQPLARALRVVSDLRCLATARFCLDIEQAKRLRLWGATHGLRVSVGGLKSDSAPVFRTQLANASESIASTCS